MSWFSKQIEPIPAHATYLILSVFLISYALLSQVIKNRLHLSEPPLATLVGIIFGPRGFDIVDPLSWGWEDNITQEFSRIVVGVQVFAVGVELPKRYLKKHWRSVAILLGPVMTFGWLVCAALIYLIIRTEFTTALIIAACLTPTDPVLAASVLSNSRFSNRVPKRIRDLLSCESGCNDGISFPFLYIGLFAAIEASKGAAIKEFVLSTVLWQCLLGTTIGVLLGVIFEKVLRYSAGTQSISPAFFIVFYFLLAILSVGIGSTLGSDDFLIAFGAGTGFAWDGWFARKTKATHLPEALDLLLNASMFFYFGSLIPWDQMSPTEYRPFVTAPRLFGLLILILVLRRIPVILAVKSITPDIKTYREALFCGHFGPMGIGALFLVIEARAKLETGTSLPLPHPPKDSPHKSAIETIWPVTCFIILGSIMVHGLSVAVISIGGHFTRKSGERAPLIGGETEGLHGMVHDGEEDNEESEDEDYRNEV